MIQILAMQIYAKFEIMQTLSEQSGISVDLFRNETPVCVG